jgi:hypothetical protein
MTPTLLLPGSTHCIILRGSSYYTPYPVQSSSPLIALLAKRPTGMSTLFKKLNLSNRNPIIVLNAPETFDTELRQLVNVEVIRKSNRKKKADFGIAFAITQQDLDDLSRQLIEAVEGEAVLWIAYPKGTSKQYRCEFNRDSGWTVIGNAGFEPVRQVSIDSDWTALRFRKVEHIKSLTRRTSMAISTEGKQRTSKESPKVKKTSKK